MSETLSEKPKPGKRFSDKPGNTRGHMSLNGKANKDRRREEAFAREAAYRSKSLTERLKGLPAEGAERQRARLTKAIEAQAEKQKAQAEKPKGEKKQKATAKA